MRTGPEFNDGLLDLDKEKWMKMDKCKVSKINTNSGKIRKNLCKRINSNQGGKGNAVDLGGIYKENLGEEQKRDRKFLATLALKTILVSYIFVIGLRLNLV